MSMSDLDSSDGGCEYKSFGYVSGRRLDGLLKGDLISPKWDNHYFAFGNFLDRICAKWNNVKFDFTTTCSLKQCGTPSPTLVIRSPTRLLDPCRPLPTYGPLQPMERVLPDGISKASWICPKCDKRNRDIESICISRRCQAPRPTPRIWSRPLPGAFDHPFNDYYGCTGEQPPLPLGFVCGFAQETRDGPIYNYVSPQLLKRMGYGIGDVVDSTYIGPDDSPPKDFWYCGYCCVYYPPSTRCCENDECLTLNPNANWYKYHRFIYIGPDESPPEDFWSCVTCEVYYPPSIYYCENEVCPKKKKNPNGTM